MDVAEGCGARCVHCVGGHTGERYGDATRADVLPGVASRLAKELDHLAAQGRRPEVLRLGVASDPLSSAPGVVEAALACLHTAFERGVRVELHTRSIVQESVADVLRRAPHMAVVVAGVMAVRDSAARVYEPGLSPAAGRLRSLRVLAAAGVRVHVRVEPLIPLVNDTQADLEALFNTMVKNGLHRAELAYLTLTEKSAKSLSRGLPRMHREMLKGLFSTEAWQNGAHGRHKVLPRILRDAGYERAVTVARNLGVTATVCPCSDPQWHNVKSCQRLPAAADKRSTLPPAQQLTLFGAPRTGRA